MVYASKLIEHLKGKGIKFDAKGIYDIWGPFKGLGLTSIDATRMYKSGQETPKDTIVAKHPLISTEITVRNAANVFLDVEKEDIVFIVNEKNGSVIVGYGLTPDEEDDVSAYLKGLGYKIAAIMA